METGAADAAADATEKLLRSLKESIRGFGSKLSSDDKRKLEEKITADDFEAAIRTSIGTAQMEAMSQEEIVATPTADFRFITPHLAQQSGKAVPEKPIEISVSSIRDQLATAELHQQIAIAGLLIPFVMVVLLPTFTGAPMDYLVAFAWAFLTDLTTQSLATAFQPLAATVKPKGL